MTWRTPLKWILLGLVVLFVQVQIWQAALVQMAHIQRAMHYGTAVDLLENDPAIFYGVVIGCLVVSDALIAWLLLKFKKSNHSHPTEK